MTNTRLKAAQIVEAAALLLARELVLPRLVWSVPNDKFIGALDDTITLRVPIRRTARTRTMRSATPLVADDFTEVGVPVKLDTHVYDLLNMKDEELTLDLPDFVQNILQPQMTSVAEGMEGVIAAKLAAAPAAGTVDFVEDGAGKTGDPYKVLLAAGKELNKLNVPRGNRVFLAGANVETALLGSDRISRVDQSGTDTALREATVNRVAGFTIVGSNAVDPDFGAAMHQTAIAFGNVAPALPDGASMKARTTVAGLLALRYLKDYDPTNASGPVDRSLVDAFCGAASVNETMTVGGVPTQVNKRLVKVDFTPAA